jgi:DNA topoisomerase-1
MGYILVILESPGKTKKVEEILKELSKKDKSIGTAFKATASYGHLRDMNPKTMSIDFENNYEPIYIVKQPEPGRKISYPKIIGELKNLSQKADNVYLLADMDREGEAIAAGVIDLLKLKKYKRLLTNEITLHGLKEALKNPTTLNQDLVNAQKARRVLDRLVGYELSPLVSKQYGGKYSAGRVQTVVDRLVVEKEEEIEKFFSEGKDATFFRVSGDFGLKTKLHTVEGSYKAPLKGDVAKIDVTKKNKEIIDLLKLCLTSEFKVFHIYEKDATRQPAPPFTTSTLQQEAHRKLGLSLADTMSTAQKLYEAGCITYMRTDSVKISDAAKEAIKKEIIGRYGQKYYLGYDGYKAKKGAQEGHEAIRPTHPEQDQIQILGSREQRLYSLIWKRTIASQMAKAILKQVHVQISISKDKEHWFEGMVETVAFPGFMKVYKESLDEEEEDTSYTGKLPKMGDKLVPTQIEAKQEYNKPPTRFQQASLVKKLEEMGIGRPSTYVNMVQVNFDRGYLEVADIKGTTKPIVSYAIQSKKGIMEKKIYMEEGETSLGEEKGKIVPTEMGKMVIEFMRKHFSEIIDYKFTADMEEQLDQIAEGKKVWHKVIDKFYKDLKPKVESVKKNIKPIDIKGTDKILGADREGHNIMVGRNKSGSFVYREVDGKKEYKAIDKPLTPSNITLEDALKLFEYPKKLGTYQNEPIYIDKGPHGKYVKWKGTNVSVKDDIDKKTAIELLEAKLKTDLGERKLKIDGKTVTVKLKVGPHGPYVMIPNGKKKPTFIPIPDGNISDADLINLIKNPPKKTYKK